MKSEFNCNPKCLEKSLKHLNRFNGNDLVRKCNCRPPVKPRMASDELLTQEDIMELTAFEFNDFKQDSAEDLLEINNEPSDELIKEVEADEAEEDE